MCTCLLYFSHRTWKELCKPFCFLTRFTFFSAMGFLYNIQIDGLSLHNQLKTSLWCPPWVPCISVFSIFMWLVFLQFHVRMQYDLLELLSHANLQRSAWICADSSITNRVYVVLHLFGYRLWIMSILLWERKSSRVGYSLREVKITL